MHSCISHEYFGDFCIIGSVQRPNRIIMTKPLQKQRMSSFHNPVKFEPKRRSTPFSSGVDLLQPSTASSNTRMQGLCPARVTSKPLSYTKTVSNALYRVKVRSARDPTRSGGFSAAYAVLRA